MVTVISDEYNRIRSFKHYKQRLRASEEEFLFDMNGLRIETENDAVILPANCLKAHVLILPVKQNPANRPLGIHVINDPHDKRESVTIFVENSI